MATVIHRGDLVRTVDKRGHRDDYRPADRHPVRALSLKWRSKAASSFAGESAQISALSVGNMFGWSISELMSLGIIGVVVAVGIVASVVLVLT